VNANAFGIRQVQEQWKKPLKLVREGDRDFIRARWNGGLRLLFFTGLALVFERKTLEDAVDRKLADRALVSKYLSSELQLHLIPS
jgi:hypothetical protein